MNSAVSDTANALSSEKIITQGDTRSQEKVFDHDTQNQPRAETLTDRDVLALAAKELEVDNLTDGERDALRIFNERLNKLEDLQNQRLEQGRLYREQQFGPNVDREAAKATKNRMDNTEAIKKYRERLQNR